MEYDIESILEKYEDDYNPGPRPMVQEPRNMYSKGKLVKETVETLASKIFKPKTELDALEPATVKPSILRREAAPLDLSQINSIMKNKEFEQAWKNYKISIKDVGRRKYDKDQFFEMWARENMAEGGRTGYFLGGPAIKAIFKNKIPGITYYPPNSPGKTTKDSISLLTRTTDESGKRISNSKTFNVNTATKKEVDDYLKQQETQLEGKVQKKGGDVNEIRQAYTKSKIGFTDELIKWLDTNASNAKYNTPEKLINGAKKVFNQPKYTEAPNKVEKNKVFFSKDKGFVIPREYQFYGAKVDSRNPDKVQKDMAMISLLKSDNPNFKGKKDTLMKFFNRDPDSPKPDLSKEEDSFLKNFSKNFIRSGAGGAGTVKDVDKGSVILRYLKNEGANFDNKLNNWNEIRRLQTDIQKELQLTDLSPNRIDFLNKSLVAVKDKQRNVSEALRKEYPDLFTGKEGDISGALVQEHKVARALGDKRLKGEVGKSFIPSTYLARAEFTPAFFNLQKLKDFDTPFMSLVEKYNNAPTKQAKLAVKEEIETLKNTFNKNSGGYLNDVDINYGTKTVKIKDKTPEIYKTSKEDTYAQILKNVKHSNTYFKNKGMNDRILQGDQFNKFQRDLKNRINANQNYKSLAIGVPTVAVATQFLSGEATAEIKPQGSPGQLNPETEKTFAERNPKTTQAAGSAVVGGTVLKQKPVRDVITKGLGKIFRGLGTNLAGSGFAATQIYNNLKEGKGVYESVKDPMVGVELMFPSLFKENISKITKNKAIQKALSGFGAGKYLNPIGATILAGDALSKNKPDSESLFIKDMIKGPDYFKEKNNDYYEQGEHYDDVGLAGLMKKYYD